MSEPVSPPAAGYRWVADGELICCDDEFMDDAGVWRKTVCAGLLAPNPVFTRHRKYRRRIYADEHD